MQSWKPGTQNRYTPYINRWVQLCFKGQTNRVQPRVSLVLDFLHMLKNIGVGYSGLNTSRSSHYSSFVTIEG